MKATGIVRRIDDLGRVVIPKEIRRTLHIRDGDPLEIYTQKDGEVIFKKYSPIGELSDFADQICDSLYKNGDGIAIVCDRDSVSACAGIPKRELIDRRISSELLSLIDSRKSHTASEGSNMPLIEGEDTICVAVAVPILSEGDVMGCVGFAAKPGEGPPTQVQIKLASAIAGFLGKQIEG